MKKLFFLTSIVKINFEYYIIYYIKKNQEILFHENIHQNLFFSFLDSWKMRVSRQHNEFEETRRHGSSRNEFRRRNFL